MKTVLHAVAWLTGIIVVTSCFRSDIHTTRIDVPSLTDAFAIRVVTNAVLNEVVGQYDGIPNSCEVNFENGLIVYHETERLRSPEYVRLIEKRIAEVGFPARVLRVESDRDRHRYRAIISVPDIKTNRDANIIIDAIAYARIGSDDPRIKADHSTRQVTATYDGRRLALKNIELAIASVGYQANDVPALLDRPDALPRGWTRLHM